ncbi:MAG: hypothetical protein FWH35_01425 [Treponema sp.]|nr:hypothetical protein [Treponema sp.]
MKNKESRFLGEQGKTVIFVHTANQFSINNSIMANAVYLRFAGNGLRRPRKSESYYLEELKKAANTDKEFLILEFDPYICGLMEKLINTQENDFRHWKLYIFFHADSCPPGEEPHTMYNLDDDKLGILWPVYNYPFIARYTIPVGHTLSALDLLKIKKDLTAPKTVEELRRSEWNMKRGRETEKASFPFYEINEIKMREFINRRTG